MRDFQPRPLQKPLIAHGLAVPRCALWASPGSGKSSATLLIVDALLLAGLVTKVLVLAPLRVARDTWVNESKRWAQFAGLRVIDATGDVAERKVALAKPADVVCINYEQIGWLVEHYGDAWPFDMIVADESTKLKGFRLKQGGKRAQALGSVAFKAKRFIELTGTPASNGLLDLWGQSWFLDRGARLGRSYNAFENRWFRSLPNGGNPQWTRLEALPHAQKEIEDTLRDLVVTIDAKDWFNLAEPVVTNHYVELPPAARKHYREVEREMFTQIAGHDIEAFSAAAKTMKCLQLANGAAYVNEAGDYEEVHTEKIQALESLVEESGGAPVLCAYNFKSDKKRLIEAFPHALDLSVRSDMAAAMRGHGKLWLGHPKSMGHGVDGLQRHCNRIVFFSLDWNLEERLQVIERIGPVRQKQAGFDRPVYVHNIVARKTVDELVLERIETKRSVQELLINAMKRSQL